MDASPVQKTSDQVGKDNRKTVYLMIGIFILILVFVGAFLLVRKTHPTSVVNYSNPFPLNKYQTTYHNPFATPTPTYQNPFAVPNSSSTNKPYQNPFGGSQ